MLIDSFLTIVIQSTYSYYNSVMINVILVSHLYLGHTSGWFPSGFTTNILYALLFSVHCLFLDNIVSTHNTILELSNIFYFICCDLFTQTLFRKMFFKIPICVF